MSARPLQLALVLATAGVAHAQDFQRTVAGSSGDTVLCVTWADRNFTYRVDQFGSAQTPGETEFTAIDAAFTTWEAVATNCSDFRFRRGQRIANPRVGKGTETDNVLTFRERDCRDVVQPTDPCLADGSCANTHACWDHNSATIGLTTVTYSTRTGVAVDADIEFNASGFLMTTISSPPCEVGRESVQCVAYDVQNTTTHEIGHAVGLDHVLGDTSTMAPTAPLGETAKRVIDVGTAQGFCLTYPRGQPPTPCDELAVQRSRIIARSTGSFGVSCVNAAAPGVPLTLLVSWLVVRRARRHRQS